MNHRTYSLIELVGVSEISYDDAAKRAIERASQSLQGLGWFKVTQLRGLIRDGEMVEYQVTLQVGFRLLSEAELQKS
jgi:dodecin